MQTWALIVDSFRHTLDRKIFWVMVAISVVIAAAMCCIGLDEDGVTLFFKWHFDFGELGTGGDAQRSIAVQILIYWVMDKYIGLIGVLLALISTAGIFPAMMEPGAIDVLLAKPQGRVKLFLGKYLGGMVFVLLQTTVFVVLTFLVAGLRWHQWLWPYFWSIPLFVLLFSYVYVCCVFFAVWMRGSLGPLLLSLVCWFIFFAVQGADSAVQMLSKDSEESLLANVTSAARWAVPHTQDIPHIAARLIDPEIAEEVLGQASFDGFDENDRQDMDRIVQGAKKLMSFNMAASLASSLGIEVLILILAMWRFARRDF